jgi:NAD(P)-dependent dehydrogenase (short-subunit alcohol dehydrogenase family)
LEKPSSLPVPQAVLALTFAREGSNIVLADINKEKADEVAAAVKKLGAGALALALDVTDRAAVDKMVKAAVAKFGAIFCLIQPVRPVDGNHSWRSIRRFGNRRLL